MGALPVGAFEGAVQPGCRSESSLQLCSERAIAQADNSPGGVPEEKWRLPSAWGGGGHARVPQGRAGRVPAPSAWRPGHMELLRERVRLRLCRPRRERPGGREPADGGRGVGVGVGVGGLHWGWSLSPRVAQAPVGRSVAETALSAGNSARGAGTRWLGSIHPFIQYLLEVFRSQAQAILAL